jgi:peptide/nickel transport system permease protein
MTEVIAQSPDLIRSDVAALIGAHKANRKKWPWNVRISLSLAVLLIGVAVFGPLFVGSTTKQDLSHRLLGIGTSGHLLGTDGLGRDVFDRVIAGSRPSLLAGVLPVLIAALLGTVLGMTAALSGRRTHGTIMRVLDVFYAFPAVLLAIGIASALGSGVKNAIIALSVAFIPPIARVVETETLRLREMDFMASARASGASWPSIASRQVLPAIGPAILVYCTTLIGVSIVYAAGLSFLGLGVAPPHAEWGLMIQDLRQYIYTNPELALVPAAAITLASVTFNVLGDGLRTLLDVRREGR